MLIPKTIGPPEQSYGQRYDFMQMRYSCQLLTIYSCAFISEGGFCRCVVLSYEGSIHLQTSLFLVFPYALDNCTCMPLSSKSSLTLSIHLFLGLPLLLSPLICP